MLDQSFSYENFRIIMDVENRKGNYLEDAHYFDGEDIFAPSREISKLIIETNGLIKNALSALKAIEEKEESDYEFYNSLLANKEEQKRSREERLEEILTALSKLTNESDFSIRLIRGQIKHGNQLYTHQNHAQNFFVLKQLQRNIYKTFKVKQADRKSIISQLKLILNDGFPKVIIRTDIKSFYETIEHSRLLSRIEENSLLSFPSKKVIKDILNQYWKMLIDDGTKTANDTRVGVPRGFGISAYLSELYMRELDRKISRIANVTYYARYVDDIFIIITPRSRTESISTNQYKNMIRNLVSGTTGLEINTDKTSVVDLRKENSERKATHTYNLTYLGYKFLLKYKYDRTKDGTTRLPLETLMSEKKLERYKSKIVTAFDDYLVGAAKYPAKHTRVNRLLLQRIKFLSNNFQLVRRKSNVFIGVYFSNEFLSETSDLERLDELLISQTVRITAPGNLYLTTKLAQISFVERFNTKRFMKFNFSSFRNDKVLGVWKNL